MLSAITTTIRAPAGGDLREDVAQAIADADAHAAPVLGLRHRPAYGAARAIRSSESSSRDSSPAI